MESTTILMIWCALLTLALGAHMIKDFIEFRKIKQLQEDVTRLKTEKPARP